METDLKHLLSGHVYQWREQHTADAIKSKSLYNDVTGKGIHIKSSLISKLFPFKILV